MEEEKICVICGKPFIATKKNHKCCCKECSYRNSQDKARRWREQERERMVREANRKNITEIAVAARKAGMTYGQYVAQMGL